MAYSRRPSKHRVVELNEAVYVCFANWGAAAVFKGYFAAENLSSRACFARLESEGFPKRFG
jgi:hypothetical protein